MNTIAQTSLIPLWTAAIGQESQTTANARELHAFLEVKSEFRNWIKNRIEQYGFAQDIDFIAGNFLPGSEQIDYYVTLDMAKELAMVERNAKGREARQYFLACEKQLKASLPDFSNPAAAARAWADAHEAKELALAQSRALAQQLETEKPYIELAHAITGSSTMYVREWIALMKEDHHVTLKEKQVRQFLHDQGYWYWTQYTPRETRAYAAYDHLFKLETEILSGYPRQVLKITGDGVLTLTPIVIAHFDAKRMKTKA